MAEIQPKSNNGLKIVIGILAVLLGSSLLYNNKISSNSKIVKAELVSKVPEKESLLKDLNDLKVSYDAAIADNASMADQLIAERAKVVRLIKEIENSKAEATRYKNYYLKYETYLKFLIVENESLRNQKEVSSVRMDSTEKVLGKTKKINTKLESKYDKLSKNFEKGAKLTITAVDALTYKIKKSGKEIVTDKSGSIDLLKISYTVAENNIAIAGDKEFYIQVIDSQSNVVGEKETIKLGDTTLKYSLISKVSYKNQTVIVNEEITGEVFTKGTYFINIFDKKDLVFNSSFTLK